MHVTTLINTVGGPNGGVDEFAIAFRPNGVSETRIRWRRSRCVLTLGENLGTKFHDCCIFVPFQRRAQAKIS